MELGLYTDSVDKLPLTEALDLAVKIGATGIELAMGGQSWAPHADIEALLTQAREREKLQTQLAERGLRLSALNCSAWPMHPVHGISHVTLIKNTIRLAELLGVDKIVTMSGCPGDGGGDTTINWIWYPWPPDAVNLLERQWEEAIGLWAELGAFAADHGVRRVALELHPLHLVYNVPTLLRLREATSPVLGANIDPSHMFWQQMDPLRVVRALGPAVHHVHLKDTELVEDEVALAGVLDQRPFDSSGHRAWRFRTVGRAHPPAFWAELIAALRETGYDDVLSIENEDWLQDRAEGVAEAAALMTDLLLGEPGAAAAS
jgi:sugar phosphate isomerase/epimerase